MDISRSLADYICRLSFEALPKPVVDFAKWCVLDWLGSALAGRKALPVQIIQETVKELGGKPQAMLVTGGKSSVIHAAAVNAAASHVMEMDDIHRGSIIHAGTVVIPAALAVGEWKGKNGRDLITAVVAGYEVCYRIGEATGPSHYRFWHSTATCGTFGAAAAAGKLLGLSMEQMVHALGSAGTQAAGLWEFIVDGAMSKQLHTAKAAMNGVLAAVLATKGFTAASKILEGDRGFFRAMSEDWNVEKITEGLGTVYKIMENSFKVHASCRHTHPAIDAVLEMRRNRGFKPEDIRRICVKTYKTALDITDQPDPRTVYAAKFSLQYCTALAVVLGRADVTDFNEIRLQDPDIRMLMSRVEVVMDPELDALYPEKWAAAVEIHLIGGERMNKRMDFPKGDPENPVDPNRLIAKFRSLTADLLPSVREVYSEKVLSLEELEDLENLVETDSAVG